MYEELVKRLREPCQYENCILCQQAADAIEELSKPRWIPVSEQLIHSGWYFVACNEWGGSAVRKAVYDEAAKKWWEFPFGGPRDITKFVTHCMPLPEPPKEGERRAMRNEQLNLAETVTDFIRSSNWLNTRDQRTLAQLRDAAVCVDSPIGEYRCHVKIYFSAQSGRKPIAVDTCLQHEIHELIFKHNVNTIGCCCGHGRKQAYIQVSPQSVQKMHDLGYEPLPEQEDGQGKWCFKPKTYFLEPVSNSYKLADEPPKPYCQCWQKGFAGGDKT